MALLVESVPAFDDTWIECLGDLARYRMAIEDEDLRDREVWSGVARYWYNKLNDTRTGSVRIAAIHTGSFGYLHRGCLL
jgi:hypothetical protein